MVVGGISGAAQFAYTNASGDTWTSISGIMTTVNCIATNGSITVVGGNSVLYSATTPPSSFTSTSVSGGWPSGNAAKVIWNPYYRVFLLAFLSGSTNKRLTLYSSSNGSVWTGINSGTAYNVYSVNDMAWSGQYTIVIGGQANQASPYNTFANQNVFMLSSDGGVTWSGPETIGLSDGTFAINIARSVVPYYNDKWLVCGQSLDGGGGAFASSPLNASGGSWTNRINGMSDCTSITANGSGWWLAINPTQIKYGSKVADITNTYADGTTIVATPSRIVWTGNKFYCIGTTGLSGNNNILQSSDGITWTAATNANVPSVAIRDIAFTPNTITLGPSDQYKRIFTTSSVTISGSLNNNEWVHLKNITPFPQIANVSSTGLILAATQPYDTAQIADTPVSVVYSNGSSLVAV